MSVRELVRLDHFHEHHHFGVVFGSGMVNIMLDRRGVGFCDTAVIHSIDIE